MTTQADIDRYHKWVATQHCMHCGIEGYSQTSHYEGYHGHLFGRGLSKKAHFMNVTSLCADRPGIEGCHTLFDNHKLTPTLFTEREGRFENKLVESEMHLCWEMQTIIAAVKGGVLKLEKHA